MFKEFSVSSEGMGNFNLGLFNLSSIDINWINNIVVFKVNSLVDAEDLRLSSFTKVVTLEEFLEFLVETDNEADSLVLLDLSINNLQLQFVGDFILNISCLSSLKLFVENLKSWDISVELFVWLLGQNISEKFNASVIIDVKVWAKFLINALDVKVFKIFTVSFAIIVDILQSYILDSTEDNAVVKVVLNSIVLLTKINGRLFFIQGFINVIGVVEELVGFNSEEIS